MMTTTPATPASLRVNRPYTVEYNQEAVDRPLPGDFWCERVSVPYFIVVRVNGDDITVLSCMRRQGEPFAKIENDDGSWAFDYSKSFVVTKEWVRKAVTYSGISGFVADVKRTETGLTIVNEWKQFNRVRLIEELKAYS
jgi:hypothetical protein